MPGRSVTSSRLRAAVAGRRLLTGAFHFLANHAAQSFFQRFAGVRNILPRSVADQRLVVAASGGFDLGRETKRGYLRPAGWLLWSFPWERDHRPAACFRKVILTFHCDS